MADTKKPENGTRRDFLYLTTGAVGAVGAATALWPLVDSMNPARDTLAVAETEVNISNIAVGQAITVVWRGRPIFIRHRTPAEIETAVNTPLSELRHRETDSERALRPEWLVMVGICTHLGCVPLGNAEGQPTGDYNGWFCPCHGSHYDESGRIRRGPAPTNLEIPPYEFLSDDVIRIG